MEFWFFFNKQIKGKSKNEKNYLHGKLPTIKRRTRKSFWVFLLNTTTNYTRKKNQKEARNIFLDFLKVFQTHKKKARK